MTCRCKSLRNGEGLARIHAGVADQLQHSTPTHSILPPFVCTGGASCGNSSSERSRWWRWWVQRPRPTCALRLQGAATSCADLELDRLLPRRPCRRPVDQAGWINRTPGGDFFGQSLGEHHVESWLGGVQAGCDYQFAGGFVIGIQGDYAWTDAEGSHDSAREFGVAYHSKIKSLASVTGRVGYAWDRFLGYVRGGGAWERDDYSATTMVLGTVYAGTEHTAGMDHRCRRRICLHQFPVRLRRIRLLRLRHRPDRFDAASRRVPPGIGRRQGNAQRRARRSQLPFRRRRGRPLLSKDRTLPLSAAPTASPRRSARA